MNKIIAIFLMFIILYSVIFLSVLANATSLVILNETKGDIRIDSLVNKCSGSIVDENKPIRIGPRWIKSFKLNEVVHTYKICGSGFCVNSAIGIEKEQSPYFLKVYIKDGFLNIAQFPDTWPGNLECH